MVTLHGRIEYRNLSHGTLAGDETFRIENLAEGGRRLEVVCQALDRETERRVELEVDPSFAPLRAAVWLREGARRPQHVRYRFEAKQVVVDTLDPEAGDPDDPTHTDHWLSEPLPVSHRIDAFVPHPLVADGWLTGSHPGRGGPEAHSLLTLSSAPQEDGSGGLEPTVIPRTLEFGGAVELDPPVLSEEEALHYRVLCSRPDWEPLDLWVRPSDRLLLRAAWPVLDGYYELVEYEERTPSHPDHQALPVVRPDTVT